MQNQQATPLGVSALDLVRLAFGDVAAIPVIKFGAYIGLAPQTARNKLQLGIFPVPTFVAGGRRFVHVADAIAYVDGLRPTPAPAPAQKSKRVRPTKAEQMARRHGGES